MSDMKAVNTIGLFHYRSGRCACVSVLLAIILLPIIAAHPILGFFILLFLLSSSKS